MRKRSGKTPHPAKKPVEQPVELAGGSVEITIGSLGQQGDGLAIWNGEPLFVPFTLPGEEVEVRLYERRSTGQRGFPLTIKKPSSGRVSAPCRHFADCGGCALQHLEMQRYRRWKIDGVISTLGQRGIELDRAPTDVFIPASTRRRATFAVAADRQKPQIGFHRSASHRVIDLQQCLILTPTLFDLVGKMREILTGILHAGEEWSVLATECHNGIDLLITAKSAPNNAQRFALADLAQVDLLGHADAKIGIARITWQTQKAGAMPEPIAQHCQPQVDFAGVLVDLPAQSFLQPSIDGEAALRDAVLRGVGDAGLVADLYAGCGTFTFPLGQKARVIAVEGHKGAVSALNQAARRAMVSDRISATVKDLEDAPLMPEQLQKIEAVVFDPPRAGARPQSEQIAKSRIPLAVGVSCNPATFARDARILIDGGFRLTDLTIVDQFIWSSHVELVGRFER